MSEKTAESNNETLEAQNIVDEIRDNKAAETEVPEIIPESTKTEDNTAADDENDEALSDDMKVQDTGAQETEAPNENKSENEKSKKKRHIIMKILIAVLILIVILAVFVIVNAKRNVKEMDRAADKTIEIVKSHYTLKEVDCSEFKDLKVMGIMKFATEQYDVEGLGNLCVMRANGGVMQMLTAIITPVKKDMPLMSVDYMYILGNRTAYVEVYDFAVSRDDVYNASIEKLKAVASDYTALNDTVPSSAWYDSIRPAGSYKKVKHKDDEEILKMLESYLETYMKASETMESLPEEQIPAKIDAMESYSHRLITEGGVSTDTFKKELGEEKTKHLFDTVMFGTENYR